MTSMTATAFGKYRLIREIGRGGEATVHLAEDPVLERRVAIKIFPPAIGVGFTGLPEGFRREVEVLLRLQHPGICTIHDAGVEDGCAFIAMSYAEGRTLAESAGIGTTEAIRFAADVAATLSAAHAVGIVHGDLKPANVLVTPEGRSIVLDFGVARLLDKSASLPRTTRLAGTLPYLAPERLAHPPEVGADVFGLGAVLFELVSGRTPFAAPTRAALVRQIADAEPPLLRSLTPSAGHDLEAVLAKALDRDPERRYRTIALFEADLARLRDGRPVFARRYGPLARSARWARQHRAAAAIVAFGVIFLAIAAAVAAVKNRDLEAYLDHARLAARRASDELESAEESNVRYERLADRRRLRDLEARAAGLVPPIPAIVPDLRRWLVEAKGLADTAGAHQKALEDVRSRGQPGGLAHAAGRFRSLAREIEALRSRLSSLTDMSEAERSLRGLLDRLEVSLPAPVARWSFHSVTDAWQDEVLSGLIDDLDRFTHPDRFRGVVADVSRRIEEVRALEQDLARTAPIWDRALRSIADVGECPRYRGLRITPQLGLEPLRRSPASGLWEFRHVPSGEAPRTPGPGEGFEVEPGTGIVLVLIPGGVARMGANRPGNEGPRLGAHVDPLARLDESPLDDVPLDPFFISKYEMTETQWVHLCGTLPGPDLRAVGRSETRKASTLPVASIDWDQARSALARAGLELPSEAQWEYAARAGTTTPWWTGADPATLESAEVFSTNHPALVGRRPPNAFGLHDVGGNVSEWCRDPYSKYRNPHLPGTGDRAGLDEWDHYRIRRGGGFASSPNELRSAWRGKDLPNVLGAVIGVRPARRVDR